MHNYKELKLWQKGIELFTVVYQLTAYFPKDEKFGLICQIQRAGVSIPSNLAEGCGRNSDKELNHFLGIVTGSAFELETQLLIAGNLGFLKPEALLNVTDKLSEIQKMLYAFRKNLNLTS